MFSRLKLPMGFDTSVGNEKQRIRNVLRKFEGKVLSETIIIRIIAKIGNIDFYRTGASVISEDVMVQLLYTQCNGWKLVSHHGQQDGWFMSFQRITDLYYGAYVTEINRNIGDRTITIDRKLRDVQKLYIAISAVAFGLGGFLFYLIDKLML